jgi:hypothetical protein
VKNKLTNTDTIISFFPKRWGRNVPDFSGIYTSIRHRLDRLRIGEIKSVYDLGLIIMNQCSTVFFDHAALADDRPPLLDGFASTIAQLVRPMF